MSRKSFENYGILAEKLDNDTLIAGRYKDQEASEKKILKNVIEKLKIGPKDSIIEIGCGAGNLLIPLSFFAKKVTGIDHEACIRRINNRIRNAHNLFLINGNFLDVPISKSYNKVLCYSVLHYLQNKKEVFVFMDKALRLLKPGGIALFGDIPNQSMKKRFFSSAKGKIFEKKWEAKMSKQYNNENVYIYLSKADIHLDTDNKMVEFNDRLLTAILERYREKGFNAYLAPQPEDLPFGNMREDIIINKID